MANAGLWGGTPAIHYLEGNGGHVVSSCLSGLSFSIYHLSSPRHWSNITPQPQLQQWEVLSSKGFQPLWQKPPYLQPAITLTMWANIRGQSPVGLCPGARVPVCPWIGVVPGCPCARASDVLGACWLSATQTLCSLEATRLQAVAVCLLIPQTVCPHWGVLTAGVKAGAWSGCSLWSAAFYL